MPFNRHFRAADSLQNRSHSGFPLFLRDFSALGACPGPVAAALHYRFRAFFSAILSVLRVSALSFFFPVFSSPRQRQHREPAR